MLEIIDKQKQVVEFYTDVGKNVTKLVKQGLTKKFRKHKEAYDYSESRRSYVYELFYQVGHSNKSPKLHYGYGVPK